MAQGRVRDLESVFHRSEAELAAALSDKRALENDVAELRAQLAKVAQAAQAVGPPSPPPSPHPGDPFTPLPPPSPHPGGVWGLGIPRDLTRRQAASPAACPACPGRGRACGG